MPLGPLAALYQAIEHVIEQINHMAQTLQQLHGDLHEMTETPQHLRDTFAQEVVNFGGTHSRVAEAIQAWEQNKWNVPFGERVRGNMMVQGMQGLDSVAQLLVEDSGDIAATLQRVETDAQLLPQVTTSIDRILSQTRAESSQVTHLLAYVWLADLSVSPHSN